MKKKYELLLFDADDTLFDYNKAELESLRETFEFYGVEFTENKTLPLYKSINGKIWKELEQGKIQAEELKAERFNRLFSELRIEAYGKEFSKKYLQCLAKSTYLFDDALAVVKHLQKKYKLAIITNGLKEVQRPRIASSALKPYFEYLIISEEAGSPKPEPEIFDYAFKLTGHTDKSTAIIIGDNQGSDILGGLNYGIDTCWFNSNRNEKREDINSTFTINKLTELLEILN